MKRAFDLAVVGAGPAGSAAALEAARLGLTVALFDPLDENADQPCGEGILPDGAAALAELGVRIEPARAQRFRELRYVFDRGRGLAFSLPRPALAIRRPDLRGALSAAARERANIRRFFSRVVAQKGQEGFVVADGERELHVRALIAADGLSGASGAWLRPSGYDSGRFGLRARFEAAQVLEGVEVHLTPTCEVYLTPLSGPSVNAAILFERPPDGAHGTEELVAYALESAPAAKRALGDLATLPEAKRLDRTRPQRAAADGLFLAGDAGAAVDPIVGCGVTIALRSGILAARAASELVLGREARIVERRYEKALVRVSRVRRALAESLRYLAAHPRVLYSVARIGGLRPELLQPLLRIAAS